MLVVSRRVGESIILGGDCLVTVTAIRPDSAEIRVRTDLEICANYRDQSFKPQRDEKTAKKRNESVQLGDDVSITVIEIRDDKVRLGFMAPRDCPLHRMEVYEAIHRHDRD